jgi:hypothetical protein
MKISFINFYICDRKLSVIYYDQQKEIDLLKKSLEDIKRKSKPSNNPNDIPNQENQLLKNQLLQKEKSLNLALETIKNYDVK